MPETRVQQVQHRVFHAAHVQIRAAAEVTGCGARAHPVGFVVGAGKSRGVVRVGVAQLVPARARPVRHGVLVTSVGLLAFA